MSYFSIFLFICITLWNWRENFGRDPSPGPPCFEKSGPPLLKKKLDPLPWAFGASPRMIWILNCYSGGSGAVVASNSGSGSTSTSTPAVAAMMDTTMERTTPSPPSGQGGGGTDPLGNYCKHNKIWQKYERKILIWDFRKALLVYGPAWTRPPRPPSWDFAFPFDY